MGGTPINRPDALGKKSRRLKALNGKRNWFQTKNPQNKAGPKIRDKIQHRTNSKLTQVSSQNAPETFFFVLHTHNGILRKQIQEIDEQVQASSQY